MTAPKPLRPRLGPLSPPDDPEPAPEGELAPPEAEPAPQEPEPGSSEVAGRRRPDEHPPKGPISCLTLIGGTLAFMVVAAFMFASSVFRPTPTPPPTGVLQATMSQAVRLGPTDRLAEIELTGSLTGQLPTSNRFNGWPDDVAPVVMNARLTGGDGAPATAADLTVETLEPAPSFAVDVDVVALAETGVVDAVRWSESCDQRADCVRRYRIGVTRRGQDGQPLELKVVLTGRLEYPTNVPAPEGAALRLTVASSPAAARAMLIQATEPETITLNPGAPAVVRDLTVVYPAGGDGPARLRGLRLRADLTPIGRPSPQPTSPSGRSATGPPGRITLSHPGASADPILVRDLTGGPLDVRFAPFGSCGSQQTCSVSIRAVFEALDPRPDASYRLRWQAEGRQAMMPGASQAIRVSVRPAVPIEVARAEGSGALTLTRKGPSAAGTALVIMVRQASEPASPAARGAGRELQAVATVTVTAEISGSTRPAPVIVTIGPSFEENGAPAVVTARAGGAPGTAIFRPLRSCRVEEVQCEEGYRIDAALAPSVSAIMTSAETVTVHWRMTVTLGSFGSAPGADEQLPTLVVQ
jgi:hypothetical protein